ncbi:MAG: DUF1697 domain-containing protein [Bacteroidota bacterium]|nr:DUF1697 domain-containing protein [Bacteroidota bacterium]
MVKYSAFLRGINVGGNNPVKMDDLKKLFEAIEFKNIRTVLASGNVLFETKQANTLILTKKIEENLKKKFGIEISVIVRSIEELQFLSDMNPFKEINVTPQTRLYITFLPEKPKNKMKIPYESPDKNFKILRVTDKEIWSILTVTEGKTVELMDIIEKEFGKKVTTRNWNTILRLLK